MNRKLMRGMVAMLTLAVASSIALQARAQNNQGQQNQQQGRGGFNQGGGGGNGNGFGGQNGPPDPAQIRQMITNQYKDALGVTDDEWAVLGPKVDKIQSLQTDLGGGMTGAMSLMMRNFSRMQGIGGRQGQGGGGGGGGRFGGGGGGGGRGPGGFDMSALLGPETPLRRKLQMLSDALDNPDTKAADIKQLLASIREDRDRARKELTAARQELIDLLTPRQEGILFQMGILE